MAPVGLMLYGYGQVEADKVKVVVDSILSEDAIILSASLKEEMLVDDILAMGPDSSFEEKDPRIMMLLGMEQEQMQDVVHDFPKDGSISRPIFCSITPINITWKMSYLIEHLLEEQKQFQK